MNVSTFINKNMPTPIICPFATIKLIANHSVPGALISPKMIVLHITQGSSAMSCYWTIFNSVTPHRVSAHFCIDTTGQIFQFIPLNDISWHASQVNGVSISVEHAGICGKQPCNEKQYASSAKLCAWLCQTFNISCDADHILPHSIASPADHHDFCCQGSPAVPGLDPNQVIQAAAKLINP
jgi:N-acetyl-anhydromuramyl-L-alanine amidase AmpD